MRCAECPFLVAGSTGQRNTELNALFLEARSAGVKPFRTDPHLIRVNARCVRARTLGRWNN